MTCGYLELEEEELNDICMFASIQKQTFIIAGDLNMNRLKPECKEGNILQDLEQVHSLQCIITEAMRITITSDTLLDIKLTNKPSMFKIGGIFITEIRDHNLVYGILSESINR